MPGPEPKLRDLFTMALECQTPAKQAAFLDHACQGDAALRGELEVLLQAHREAGSFLQEPSAYQADSVDVQVGQEQTGTVIGPYKLLEQIGEGGMGTVWMAQQTEPVRRLVALKLIKTGMDSKQVIARFEAERQALAIMDHANIARVLDAGTTEAGRPYFVMDLVKGDPITKYCDDHHLTPRKRLELFVPVCHAIQHAHQKGIIHRDLKPSNVLVAPYDGKPVVKVIDFGVAKAAGQQLTGRTMVTGLGSIVGTLEYMSPEQAELNNHDIDTRSDIYALGVLLYELLTGSPPFSRTELEKAGMLEMMRIIREQEPSKPSTKLSTAEGLPSLAANRGTEPAKLTKLVRGDLDWIVMKALEKDRNHRYETANSFAMDLQRYLADEPVLACPPSTGYRLRKFVRRKKGPVLAASLFVLALVGGIIGTTWGAIRATSARSDAVHEAEQKEAALTQAQDKLWLSLYDRARAGRFSAQMGQRLGSLGALAEAAHIRSDDRLRDEAIAAMALVDVRRVPGWHTSPPQTDVVAFARHYRLYARANAEGIISIRTIPDDQEIQRITSGRILPTTLHFSPDQRFLLGLGEWNTLRVWRVADGQPALEDQPRQCVGHSFSPDGRILAVGQQQSVLFFDLTTGQEVRRWLLPRPVHSLAFHPNNGKLAIGYSQSDFVSVCDASSGTVLTDLRVGKMKSQVVAWHPDGERLAVASADPRIQIWHVSAKYKVATLEGHVQRVSVLTFHPEGDLLASYGWDGQLLLWHPSSGRLLMRLTAVTAPEFSVDGRWLGVTWQGGKADLLEVTPSREYRTLVNATSTLPNSRADISPDGRLLAVGMDDGTRLWDLRSGREVAALPSGTIYVSFESDGKAAGAPNRPVALLTGGWHGLLRWPVTSDGAETNRVSIGPPQQLCPLRRAWFARSQDGRTLAVASEENGANRILDLETGTVTLEVPRHPRGEVRALSGDGRWAASSGWHSDRVRLWDANTGQLVHEWVQGKRAFVFFTPDSRALIIAQDDEFSFHDVATLQPIRRLARDAAQFPGHVAFSADGKLMAVEMASGVIHLKEVASGRTMAKFDDPQDDRATWQGFTPDGTQLVVVASYARAIHIWDLRAIRTRLKEMNLDWDWPAFPPAAVGNRADEPLTITVVPGILALTGEQKAVQTIEQLRRSVEAEPDSAAVCNSLAWTYLTVPESLRDVNAALTLAEKAVRLDPGNGFYRNTLGVAYYRAGRFREAAELLQSNVRHHPAGIFACDLYFLAMSYHRLGETARARDYFDWAVCWADVQQDREGDQQEELSVFRAEAEELLSIHLKNDQQPGVGGTQNDDRFAP